MSQCQSGFRKFRGTMEAVWAHKWITAKSLHFRRISFILGIDFSKAFDTIDRSKLIAILSTFLNEDETRMLLTKTSLNLRLGQYSFDPFINNVGVPQGDYYLS